MNTTIPLIIKTRQVNTQQKKNKIIYTIKRLQPLLQAECCMQMIPQAIIFNTIMLWVSADMSAPPLANMRFTTANNIYLLDIMFDSKLCKQLIFFR